MAQTKYDRLRQELLDLKLNHIAENYREVLRRRARNCWPSCREVAMAPTRVRLAKLPALKTLEGYDFNFPKKIPKQKVLRLFDCQFVDTFGCAVSIGARVWERHTC